MVFPKGLRESHRRSLNLTPKRCEEGQREHDERREVKWVERHAWPRCSDTTVMLTMLLLTQLYIVAKPLCYIVRETRLPLGFVP